MGIHSEKPLKLNVSQLEEIAEALEALIRGVNSYCFHEIIKRTYSQGLAADEDEERFYSWKWKQNAVEDKERFATYYRIFASTKQPNKSHSPESLYEEFIRFIDDFDARAAKKAIGKVKSKALTVDSAQQADRVGMPAVNKKSVAVAGGEKIAVQVAEATKPTTQKQVNWLSKLRKFLLG